MGMARGMQLVTYIPHIATFNGRHNEVKSKCFIVLYLAGKYLSPKEVKAAAGLPWEYCSRWHRLGYLVRKVVKGRIPYYVYQLSLRGRHFVEDRIPPEKYEEYLKEIELRQIVQR